MDLQDDELPGVQMPGDLPDRRHDVGKIRILGLAQRRRHTDIDAVETGELCEVGGGPQPAAGGQRLDVGPGHIDPARVSARDPPDLVLVHVEPNCREPRLGELQGQRQTDIAEPDHAEPGCAGSQPVDEVLARYARHDRRRGYRCPLKPSNIACGRARLRPT